MTPQEEKSLPEPVFGEMAALLRRRLPEGFRIGVIGGTLIRSADTPAFCRRVGRALGDMEDVVLLTGGVTGVGETVGRAFFERRISLGRDPNVFHILPEALGADWDYGATLRSGKDMRQRREVLGRLARIYLAVEGGSGTAHEAEIAAGNGALVIPAGRYGGAAGDLYRRIAPGRTGPWQKLGDPEASGPEQVDAVVHLVRSHLQERDHPAR